MSAGGTLYLVTTPVSQLGMIDQLKKEKLDRAHQQGDLICVEDHRPARRRWISWGLDRRAVDHFVLYNEHTRNEAMQLVSQALMAGKNAYLMSDGGVPAFCDPGSELVDFCHRHGIAVLALDGDNSVVLSLALSGFGQDNFYFAGMIPKSKGRVEWLSEVIERSKQYPVVLMDTGYRLERFVSELADLATKNLQLALVLEIGNPEHRVLRGAPVKLLMEIQGVKANFVAVVRSHICKKVK